MISEHVLLKKIKEKDLLENTKAERTDLIKRALRHKICPDCGGCVDIKKPNILLFLFFGGCDGIATCRSCHANHHIFLYCGD